LYERSHISVKSAFTGSSSTTELKPIYFFQSEKSPPKGDEELKRLKEYIDECPLLKNLKQDALNFTEYEKQISKFDEYVVEEDKKGIKGNILLGAYTGITVNLKHYPYTNEEEKNKLIKHVENLSKHKHKEELNHIYGFYELKEKKVS